MRLLCTDPPGPGLDSMAGRAVRSYRSELEYSQYRLGKAAARHSLERAGDGEHGLTNHGPLERAGLQSVIDSDRQPPGADLGGAGDGGHGGTSLGGPQGRAGS